MIEIPDKDLSLIIFPAFAQSYILTENFYVVGALFSGLEDTDINTFDQLSPTDKTCYIYRCRQIPDAFLCLCKTDVSPEQSYSFTEQVDLIFFLYNNL
jgi:hypothetical protein